MKSSRTILTLCLAFLYFLILGHNLLPHTHHSNEDNHEHHQSSLLDNLLDHHEHSSDFGDDLVDIFCLSDDDTNLQFVDQLLYLPFLSSYVPIYIQNNRTFPFPPPLNPVYLSKQEILVNTEDRHAHTLRGPPTV